MCHRYDRHAGLVQRWQEFVVEFITKFRVLVGGPFVQQKNGAPLQEGDDERQTLALTTRQVESSKLRVGKARLGNQAELRQQAPDLGDPDCKSRRAGGKDDSR